MTTSRVLIPTTDGAVRAHRPASVLAVLAGSSS